MLSESQELQRTGDAAIVTTGFLFEPGGLDFPCVLKLRAERRTAGRGRTAHVEASKNKTHAQMALSDNNLWVDIFSLRKPQSTVVGFIIAFFYT